MQNYAKSVQKIYLLILHRNVSFGMRALARQMAFTRVPLNNIMICGR